MNLLLRLWAFLTVLGPSAPAASPPKEPEATDRGPFDPPDGEEDDSATLDADDADEADEDAADEDLEDDGAAELQADDEDDEDADEEDEEEAPEDEEESDADFDLDAGAHSLIQSWEARLSALPAPAPPRIPLADLRVSPEALERFNALRAKGENGEHNAEAIQALIEDVGFQLLDRYHQAVVNPMSGRVDGTARNLRRSKELRTLRREFGKAITPTVEKRMADLIVRFQETYGAERADRIPLKQLYRMAGGKAVKQPKGKGAEARAKSQKRAALAATRGPRATGALRPDTRKPKQDKALLDFSQDVRASGSFFSLG